MTDFRVKSWTMELSASTMSTFNKICTQLLGFKKCLEAPISQLAFSVIEQSFKSITESSLKQPKLHRQQPLLSKWKAATKWRHIDFERIALPILISTWSKKLLCINMATMKCSTISNDHFDFFGHTTVQDGMNLYTVKQADLTVIKYTNILDTSKV